MHPFKHQAIQLRQEGYSYNEIQKLIRVSKGTLSYWLRNIHLTSDIKKQLAEKSKHAGAQALIHRNKAQTNLAIRRAEAIRLEASKQMQQLSLHELWLIGIALYWAEGYKRGADGSIWKCVDFTNSDPAMVAIMMHFFRKCCAVSEKKFRVHLMIHDHSDEQGARLFWSRLTKLPLTQFPRSSFVISKTSRHKRTVKLPYGTIHIRINDVKLFFQIIGWIDGLKQVSFDKRARKHTM